MYCKFFENWEFSQLVDEGSYEPGERMLKQSLKNNSILKLIFRSDNLYSMIVPSLPSWNWHLWPPPGRDGLSHSPAADTPETDNIQFSGVKKVIATVSSPPSHQSSGDKPRKIISLRKCLGARLRQTRLKFNHGKWKIDLTMILLNISYRTCLMV